MAHPAEDLFLSWLCLPCTIPLPHQAARHAGTGSRILGDSCVVKAPLLTLGGERVPPSLLLSPRAMGRQGETLASPAGFSVPGPSPGSSPWPTVPQLVGWPGAWPSGLRPAAAGGSPGIALLCTGPLPPACCRRALQVPHFNGRFLSSPGPMAPGGSLTAPSLTSAHQSSLSLSLPETPHPILYVTGQTAQARGSSTAGSGPWAY